MTLPALGWAEWLGWETAKGHVFITLEDEEGLVDLIMRLDVYHRYRGALRDVPLLLTEGRLQVYIIQRQSCQLRKPDTRLKQELDDRRVPYIVTAGPEKRLIFPCG